MCGTYLESEFLNKKHHKILKILGKLPSSSRRPLGGPT